MKPIGLPHFCRKWIFSVEFSVVVSSFFCFLTKKKTNWYMSGTTDIGRRTGQKNNIVWTSRTGCGMLHHGFEPHQCLWIFPSVRVWKRFGCRADHNIVSRCCTRGESGDSIVCRWENKQTRDPPWLWSPEQTSPDVQTRVSVATQKGLVCWKFKKNTICEHLNNEISWQKNSHVYGGTTYLTTMSRSICCPKLNWMKKCHLWHWVAQSLNENLWTSD